ncbi:MAG: hypothetical protein P8130_08925 [Deltaproteobacteria bacterium]
MKETKKGSDRPKKPFSQLTAMIIMAALVIIPILFLFEPGDWQKIITDPNSNRLLFIGFHMLVTYLISHSFLHPQLDRFLDEHHWSRPRMPAGKRNLYAFLFIAIPGFPYAVKNYLLALSGLPFLHYLAICWTVQLVMGIPFIVLGEAAKLGHGGTLLIALAMMAGGFLVVRWLRREMTSSPPEE